MRTRSLIFAVATFLTLFCGASRGDVRVDAFTAVNDLPTTHWIGAAIHDSLDADFSRSPANQSTTDFIVVGSYQVVDAQVRITGHVTDAGGHPVGAIKASGDTHDFFKLEDGLSDQVRSIIERSRVIASPQATRIAIARGGPSAASLATAYSGPLKFDRKVLADYRAENFVPDHNRRAATYRYIYGYPSYGYFGFGGYGFGSAGFGGYNLGGFGGFNSVSFRGEF